jgi:hypothetical protein
MSKEKKVTEKDLRKLIVVVPESIEPKAAFCPEFDMEDPGVPTNVYMSGGVHRQSPVTAVLR